VEEFDAVLGKPYEKGYVVLPVKFLEEAIKYTQTLNVTPMIPGANDENKTSVKLLLIAIDMLRKDRYSKLPFNIKNISKLLGVSESEVTKMIQQAMDLGMIRKTEAGCYKINFDKTEEPAKKMDFNRMVTAEEIGQLYIEHFKQAFPDREPSVLKSDLYALREIVDKYDLDQIDALLGGYFKLNDDFLKNGGYQLKWLPNRIPNIQAQQVLAVNPEFKDRGYKFINLYSKYYKDFYGDCKQIVTDQMAAKLGERLIEVDDERLEFYAKASAQETNPDRQKLMLLSSLVIDKFSFVWQILEDQFNLNYIKEAREKKISSQAAHESTPTDLSKLRKVKVLNRRGVNE